MDTYSHLIEALSNDIKDIHNNPAEYLHERMGLNPPGFRGANTRVVSTLRRAIERLKDMAKEFNADYDALVADLLRAGDIGSHEVERLDSLIS